MLRQIICVFLIFVASIGGGAWSVDAILRHFNGFGQLKIGQWEAFPKNGTQDGDVYARARSAKLETIALGRAEGLVFTRWHDEEGHRLRSSCRYLLEGTMPEASFFTLYAVDLDQKPRKTQAGRPHSLNSDNVLRYPSGDYRIFLAPQAQEGNWLAIDPADPTGLDKKDVYGLVLTLYDTPLITTTGMRSLEMPRLTLDGGACD